MAAAFNRMTANLALITASRDELDKEIEEREQAENALRRYEHIVSSTTDMLALIDRHYVYLAANAAYLQAFGKTSDEMIGRTVSEIFGDEFFNTTIRPKADRCLAGENVRYDSWFEFPGTGRKYMDITYSPYRGPSKKIQGFVVTGRDITERKQAEKALQASEANFRAFFENVQDIFFQTDTNGVIVEISPSVERYGYTQEELIGTSVLEIYEDPAQRAEVVKEVIEKGELDDYEIRLKTADGRVIDVSLNAHSRYDTKGERLGIEGTMRDISLRKQAENALERSLEAERERARRDPLTGALNHGAITEALREECAAAEDGPLAVAMVDLDDLKAINDTFGHQMGDEALTIVANVLSRDKAIVGRYGGDEFIVILPGADRAEAERYRDVVTAKLLDVHLPDPETNAKIQIVVSWGLAVYPEEAATIVDLIHLSDSAMYAAKRQRPVSPDATGTGRSLSSDRAAMMVGQIVPLLTASGTIEDKLRLVAHRLSVGAGYDAVNVDVFAWATGLPTARNTFSNAPEEVENAWKSDLRRMEDEPILQHVKSTRRALIVDDPQNDERLTEIQLAVLRAAELQSAVVVPLFWEDDMIGVLSVATKQKDAFTTEDIEFLNTIASQITSVVRMASLLDELQSTSDHLAQAREESVLLLAAAAEAHDHTTGLHLQGVRALTEALARELDYTDPDAIVLGLASVLHDIGKIRVPDTILTSPAKLEASQWEVMKQHTIWGADFLSGHEGFGTAATVALHHHEHWDGGGYPQGIAGDAIPEPATIVAVADAFDAITHNRPYRHGRSLDEAVAEIAAHSGKQFNPKVVAALNRLHQRNELPTVYPEVSDTETAA